jgi:hypothetical protein
MSKISPPNSTDTENIFAKMSAARITATTFHGRKALITDSERIIIHEFKSPINPILDLINNNDTNTARNLMIGLNIIS